MPSPSLYLHSAAEPGLCPPLLVIRGLDGFWTTSFREQAHCDNAISIASMARLEVPGAALAKKAG